MKPRTFLLYCICLINLVTTAPIKYALVGNSTTFKTANNTPELPDEILWKHNGNKMVEFDGQQQQTFNQFKDRITLDWHTAELKIANLKYEDSGEYVVEKFTKEFKSETFKLEVIDPVPTPSISCKINAESNATLTCSAEVKGPYTKLEFSWILPGKEKSSSNLEIKLGDKQDSQVYKCKVKTQLSEETASFTAKDCYTGNSSAGMIVGIVVGLFILLVIVLFCLYKKGCLSKQQHNVGGHDEEKQTQLGNDVKENNGGGIEEKKCLLVREETMPSTQPLHQRKIASKNQQDESPSVLPQPPLKPSRSIVSPSKSQTHNKEGEVNGDVVVKSPESDALPSEKTADVVPEKNQLEIPSSPPQPPLKPSRSIRSQTHNKEGEVNGDAAEKGAEGPESDASPSEKAADVDPGSEQNQHEIISPVLTVPVEQHNTEPPHAKEAIKETEAKVSESDPPSLEQKTGTESDLTEKQKTKSSHPPPVAAKPSQGSYIYRRHKNSAGEEDSEKKKEEEVSSSPPVPSSSSVSPTDTKEAVEQAENPKENSSGINPPVSKGTADVLPDSEKKKEKEVSSSPPVPSSSSVSPTDTKEAVEQAENPKENSSGIDPPVSEETTVVLPGSDVVGDEHEQPKCGADTSVSAPAEPLAPPVTQNVPKTPPNKEEAGPEGNGSTGPASPEPSERNAERPEVKDSQKKNQAVKTPPPPTAEPNPKGAGKQTGAEQQEEDERVPPAEEEESQREDSRLSDHEQEQEESFQTPPTSPKRSPQEAKAESDSSSSGEDKSKEDEGGAALSEPKRSP